MAETFSVRATAAVAGVLCIAALLPAPAAAATPYASPVLFTRPGFTQVSALDINDAGDIVGISDSVGFLLRNGVFTTVQRPGFDFTGVLGISNAGLMAGASTRSVPGGSEISSFLYTGTEFIDLFVPGFAQPQARGISPDGRYVSVLETAGTVRGGVLDRQTDQVFSVAAPPGTLQLLHGVNSQGVVTGTYSPSGGGTLRGFAYDIRNGTVTTLPDIQGSRVRLRDVNDAGFFAGGFGATAIAGPANDLSWLSLAGYTIAATGINSAGQLVGFANSFAGGVSQPWTASPIPEPATWALWGLGLAGVAALARRRQPPR